MPASFRSGLPRQPEPVHAAGGAAFLCNPLPMWVYDTATLKVVDVNAAALERYGYSRDEFLRLSLEDLRQPEDVPDLHDKLRALSGENTGCSRVRHVTATGETLAVDVYGRQLDGPGRTLRVVCAVDRTTEHDALQALHALKSRLQTTVEERTAELSASEALYRTLSELSPQIIWQAKPDGAATYVNGAWEALVGPREGGWLGHAWMAALHPDDVEVARTAFVDAARDRGRFHARLRFRGRDGTYRIFLCAAAPLLRPDGSIDSWVGVDTDVTELERRAHRLRQLNSDLETMSYTVSHDLRAPVQVIQGFLDAVLASQVGHVDDDARRCLERARRNAARMDELIRDLLALASLSRETLACERFEALALAREVTQMIQDRYPDRAIECSTSGAACVVADRRLFRVVFENLIDNAVKFSPGEGACRIEVCASDRGDEAVMQVRDRGVGFPEDLAPRLFRPFQRLHPKGQFEGTGIGLATVARIVQLHGGTIAGRNRHHGGAAFEIRIPLRRPDALPAPLQGTPA